MAYSIFSFFVLTVLTSQCYD